MWKKEPYTGFYCQCDRVIAWLWAQYVLAGFLRPTCDLGAQKLRWVWCHGFAMYVCENASINIKSLAPQLKQFLFLLMHSVSTERVLFTFGTLKYIPLLTLQFLLKRYFYVLNSTYGTFKLRYLNTAIWPIWRPTLALTLKIMALKLQKQLLYYVLGLF